MAKKLVADALPSPVDRPDLYDSFDGLDAARMAGNPVAISDRLSRLVNARKGGQRPAPERAVGAGDVRPRLVPGDAVDRLALEVQAISSRSSAAAAAMITKLREAATIADVVGIQSEWMRTAFFGSSEYVSRFDEFMTRVSASQEPSQTDRTRRSAKKSTGPEAAEG